MPSGTGFNAGSVYVYDLCIVADVFPHFQEVICLYFTSTLEGVLISSSGALIITFWIHKFEQNLFLEVHTWARMFLCFCLLLNFVCKF
jgi:hypothetical protein